jgi:putative nucleotidyltransferase-like protein
MKPEVRFILAAVASPSERSVRELELAAGEVVDWELVAELAIRNRVVGFVKPALENANPRGGGPAARLQESLFETLAEVALLEAELQKIVGVLRAESIPVMVFKGPALARTVYPAPHLRPYHDIDLNVHIHDLERSLKALEAAGYTKLSGEPVASSSAGIRSGTIAPFEVKLEGALGIAKIELHTDPLQLGILTACEEDRWARSEPLPGSPGALMLSPSDQITQLALHVHKHGYNRLIWLKDIDLMLRSGRSIEWDLVSSVAQAEGISAAVWYALLMAQHLLQAPSPSAAMETLRPALPLRRLYSALWPVHRVAGLQSMMRWRLVQFDAADSLRGMLPSLVLLGRRGLRARALVEALIAT